MQAYYKERALYMKLLYCVMIFGKTGHIRHTVSSLTHLWEETRNSSPIYENYPQTPEGDERFTREALIVIAQHTFATLLVSMGIILLHYNLKWARRINPWTLTLAFAFDLPIF